MSPRPVHYHAHGSGALFFDCYHRDLRAYVASGYETTSPMKWTVTKYTLPTPQRTTDLRKVTCPECWVEIGKLAAARKAAAETARLNAQVADIVERQGKAVK